MALVPFNPMSPVLYASLVGYYSVYKLKRFNAWIVYVYLLCFFTYRYQRLLII